MNDTTKKVTLNKDRVKQAMKTLKGTGKNNRFTNEDLADLWHYANKKSISKFFKNTPIEQERLQELANKCNKDNKTNIRWEYLAGFDNYETIEDMERSLKYKAISEYKDIVNYLNSLGLVIVPSYYFQTSINQLINISKNEDNLYDDIIPYFTEDSKKHIQERISHNFNMPEYKEQINEYIELNDNPKGSGLLSIDELMKEEKRDPAEYDYMDEYMVWACDIFNDTELVGIVAPMYKLYLNNENLGLLDILSMQAFFKHIDSICKASIDSLLKNHSIFGGVMAI